MARVTNFDGLGLMDALINVVLPVFGVVLTGYLAGRAEVLGPDSAAALNRFVFFFALPPALFVFVARAPVERIFNWPFIGALVCGELGTILLALLIGRYLLGQDIAARSVCGLAAMLANTVYMGLPILLTAYGPEGALPPIIATLCLLPFTISVVAVLEGTQASKQPTFRMAGQVASRVLRNPLIISPLLGVFFSAAALPLPKAASNYLDLMAATVGPAALFSIGLSLVQRKLTGNMGEVIWLSALKAVFNPVLTLTLVTFVFSVEPFWKNAAIILSAMPTAANAYVVAQQYDVQVETVTSVVVISTGMSVITISLLLVWLGVG